MTRSGKVTPVTLKGVPMELSVSSDSSMSPSGSTVTLRTYSPSARSTGPQV